MNHNQTIGQYGESLAKEYLVKKGYKIIASNVKAGYKEIDIVASLKKTLVFVEVKTRTSSIYGDAEDALIYRKIENLKKAVMSYLSRDKNNFPEFRLDFIAVDIGGDKKTANIKHYEDII